MQAQRRVPDEQAIEEVRMADAVRPRGREGVDRVLDAEPAALDEVAHDEVARAVESVVAVDADDVVLAPARLACRPRLLVLADLIHECDETRHFGVGGRNLRHRRELVVLDALPEALGVVDRVVVADVNDVLDDMSPSRLVSDDPCYNWGVVCGPVGCEHFRGMFLVNLSEGLHCSEHAGNRLGDRLDAFPLGKIFDVPLAVAREMLQLPTPISIVLIL